jgi:hypothetical protein
MLAACQGRARRQSTSQRFATGFVGGLISQPRGLERRSEGWRTKASSQGIFKAMRCESGRRRPLCKVNKRNERDWSVMMPMRLRLPVAVRAWRRARLRLTPVRTSASTRFGDIWTGREMIDVDEANRVCGTRCKLVLHHHIILRFDRLVMAVNSDRRQKRCIQIKIKIKINQSNQSRSRPTHTTPTITYTAILQCFMLCPDRIRRAHPLASTWMMWRCRTLLVRGSNHTAENRASLAALCVFSANLPPSARLPPKTLR